jgi:hypothetical protein
MLKVGNLELGVLGLQFLAPNIGDPESGALGPQLSVLKVDA